MPSALSFACTTLPPPYTRAVEHLRELALVVGFYTRPARKHGWNEGSRGALLKEQRKVMDETKSGHFWSATAESFPQPEFDQSAPADLVAAIRECVRRRDELPAWRESRLAVLREIEADLRPVGRQLVERMCPPSLRIAAHMNLAFMAACIDAIEWPDTRAVERWVHGHTIVGEIPDTGLFRPLEQPYEVPACTISPAANRVWNRDVIKSIEKIATHASAEDAAILHEVEKLTRTDRRN